LALQLVHLYISYEHKHANENSLIKLSKTFYLTKKAAETSIKISPHMVTLPLREKTKHTYKYT